MEHDIRLLFPTWGIVEADSLPVPSAWIHLIRT